MGNTENIKNTAIIDIADYKELITNLIVAEHDIQELKHQNDVLKAYRAMYDRIMKYFEENSYEYRQFNEWLSEHGNDE